MRTYFEVELLCRSYQEMYYRDILRPSRDAHVLWYVTIGGTSTLIAGDEMESELSGWSRNGEICRD